MYKCRVLAFSGNKFSGKSTCSYIVKDYYNSRENYKDWYVEIISFADPLKRLISDIFNLNKEECYIPSLKEQPLSYWNVSPRDLMQKIGTDLFRDKIHEVLPSLNTHSNNIWAASLYKKIIDLKNYYNSKNKNLLVIIDDCRFDDEYNIVKKLNGIVVKIIKDIPNSSNTTQILHQSESGCKFDYYLKNNKNIYSLKKNLHDLINHLEKPHM